MKKLTCSFCGESILTFPIRHEDENFCTSIHRELWKGLTVNKKHAVRLLNLRLAQSEFAFPA